MANTFIFDDEEEPQPTMESPQEYPSDEVDEEGGEEEGESGNRTFLIIAIVLGVIILLTLICGAILAFTVFIPAQNARSTEQALAIFNATQTAVVVEQTAVAQAFTPTPTLTETPTLTPTTTPVILFPTETQPVVVVDPATATLQALRTQLGQSLTASPQATSGTTTPVAGARTPSPTELSKTGFADEVGLPGLFIAAVILLAVILLARRLRQTPLPR